MTRAKAKAAAAAPDFNSTEVPLGSGSYEYDALFGEGGAIETAAASPPEEYDTAVATALADADQLKLADYDPRYQPGYEFQEVTRELAPDVEVTETISVAIPDADPVPPPNDAGNTPQTEE